jgi:hypothetical protein
MSETPPDPFESLKQMWAPIGLPMQGFVAPLLDPEALDKKISDLKMVENWLSMNLNVLRMSIQGLEMQKATLSTFQMFRPSTAPEPKPKQDDAPPPQPAPTLADAWWNMLQQAQSAMAAPKPETEKKPQ